MPLTQSAIIKVNGSQIQETVALKLVEVRVEQSVTVASRALLRFTDADFEIIDGSTFAIGKAVVVQFNDPTGSPEAVFDGEVTAIGLEQTAAMRHELVIEAYDKTHRMSHNTNPKTYRKMSYGDIVSQLCGEHGLSAGTIASSLKSPKHEYIMQTTSDRSMFDRIAFQTGTEWLIDDGQLVFRDRSATSPTVQLEYGDDLRKFKVRFAGSGHIKGVTVTTWDPATKKAVVGQDAAEVKAPTGSSNPAGLSAMRSSAASSSFGNKLLTGTMGSLSQNEAGAVAAALGRRQAANELIARGEAMGNTKVKAGIHVTIKNMGVKMSGDYYLTEVEHIFGRQGDLVTRFVAGGIEAGGIVDLVGAHGGKLDAWGQNGLVVGIVTNNKNDENPGTVKVKFPTFTDTDESAWARLVMPGAGNNKGMVMMPEINDEVVVGFEHGDLRRPYIIGAVWNGKDKFPAPVNGQLIDAGAVQEWSIQTRSGHKLAFHDGTKPEESNFGVALSDTTTKLYLGKDKVQLHAASKSLELKSGSASITIDDQGNITIKGAKITIDAEQDLAASGANVTLKSKASTKIEASADVSVKGNAGVKVETSAILQLKGSLAQIN